MELKVEITDAVVQVITGDAKKTGKPYNLPIQDAYLFRPGQKYPDKFELMLPRDRLKPETPKDKVKTTPEDWNPYPAGMYSMDVHASLDVYMNRLVVRPVLALVDGKVNKAA